MGFDGICVFGGTGFLGRRIVRDLLAHDFAVRIASRRPERSRTSFSDSSKLESVRADIEDAPSTAIAMRGARAVVNAVSLYVERGSRTFESVHVRAAARLAEQARRTGVEHIVHLSGVGADHRSPSPYIRSRGRGEDAVQGQFPGAAIVRPTVMFAPDDAFLNALLRLLRRLPALPMFGNGGTRLQPVHVDDVAEAIARAFERPGQVYELGGPRVYTYEQLLRTIAAAAGTRPVLIAMPFPLWHALARVAELLPQAPLTRNQVELMQIDTVVSPALPGMASLGISPQPLEPVLEAIVSGSSGA
jgi:NADH dehydrogenase